MLHHLGANNEVELASQIRRRILNVKIRFIVEKGVGIAEFVFQYLAIELFITHAEPVQIFPALELNKRLYLAEKPLLQCSQ